MRRFIICLGLHERPKLFQVLDVVKAERLILTILSPFFLVYNNLVQDLLRECQVQEWYKCLSIFQEAFFAFV